jgi:TolA-binding protein
MSASKSWRIRIASVVVMFAVAGQPAESFADKAGDDFNLGVGFWRRSRWTLSAETFERFVKDYPEHERVPLARFYLGLSYSSLRKYGLARGQFQEYVRLSPDGSNLAAARYRIGECSYYLGEFEAAASQLSEFVEQHPTDKLAGWGKLQLGEALVQLERWDEGDRTLQDVIANTTDKDISRQAQYTLALSLEKQRNYNDAVTAYLQVAQLGDTPEAVRALARAGTIRFRQEQYDRAAALYDEIVTRFPDSRHAPSASLHSGRALYRTAKYENALRRFEQVAKDSPESVEAMLFSGMALVKLERVDEARSTLQQAFDAAGDSDLAAEILFEQSRLEQLAGQQEKAAAMYADLADRWPEDPHVPDALFNAASLLLEMSDTEAAQRLLRRLETDHPEAYAESRTKFLSGRLLIQLKQPDMARAALQQVLDSDDSDPRSIALHRQH